MGHVDDIGLPDLDLSGPVEPLQGGGRDDLGPALEGTSPPERPLDGRLGVGRTGSRSIPRRFRRWR
ncbi:hypothetical protein BRC93_08995 [Halobacteriales archaeon QS_5_70_15]|nr:MAG: hypothetical protein BRC93_08995 [Halobacteriales archaeon QS_5_70_15]